MIRKNMRFKGASAKSQGKRTHADKQQARYLSMKPLTPAQQRAQDAHKARLEALTLPNK